MLNTGLITNKRVTTDQDMLVRYNTGKHALVAQGGGQKGIFTAGVLDSFYDHGLDIFDVFYGTSAGALNLTAFLCGQRGLGRDFILELTTQPEFFRLFKHVRRKQRLDLDWAFEQLCNDQYSLDIKQGQRNLGQRQAYAAVTNLNNLHDEYLPIMNSQWQDVLKATCAIPALYRHDVEINHNHYVDGGVSAAIPAQEAWRKGARLISVIRTDPVDIEADLEPETSDNDVSFLKRIGLEPHFAILQNKISARATGWKQELSQFLQQQISKSMQVTSEQRQPLLNGGRWLFGSNDIYRLCHLLGENFDAGLMDMLLVHHQTFTLTHNFMLKPPDDCFILQIAPDEPLKSSPLSSKAEDLAFDYQSGIEAGERYVETLLSLSKA